MRATLLREVPAGEVTLATLLEENVVITSSVLVNRSLLGVVGAFSTQPGFRSVEDYELWLRVATRAPIHYLDEPLVIYRDDTANSIRRDYAPSCHWQKHLAVLAALREHLTTAGPTPPDNRLLHAIAKTQLRRHIQRCAALYRESCYASCIRELTMLCATQPLAAAREIVSRIFRAAGHGPRQD